MDRQGEYWATSPTQGHPTGGHPARRREHEWAEGTRMIFKKGRKRGSDSAVEDSTADVGVDDLAEPAEAADDESAAEEGEDLATFEELDWRSSGPYDITEVDSVESTEESPKIDLGSLILTPVP